MSARKVIKNTGRKKDKGPSQDFAKFLQSARLNSGLTQADVAHHFGYSTYMLISIWERGVQLPSVDDLKSLAKLYSVDADSLFEKYLKVVIANISSVLVSQFSRSTNEFHPSIGSQRSGLPKFQKERPKASNTLRP